MNIRKIRLDLASHFQGWNFEYELLEQNQRIAYFVPGDERGVITAGLTAGSEFDPRAHRQDMMVIVIDGAGTFKRSGIGMPYRDGSTFLLPKGTQHCFFDVQHDTVFKKAVIRVPIVLFGNLNRI